MAILHSILEAAASRYFFTARASSITEAKAQGKQTAFLSHSSKDKTLARGLQTYLEEKGWNVYIYWQDEDLEQKPNRETALRVQENIRKADWFLFLATSNSLSSRWCPWEIGYADGIKKYENIMIVPTAERSGQWYGSEYLQIYRQIADERGGGFYAPFPGQIAGTKLEYIQP